MQYSQVQEIFQYFKKQQDTQTNSQAEGRQSTGGKGKNSTDSRKHCHYSGSSLGSLKGPRSQWISLRLYPILALENPTTQKSPSSLWTPERQLSSRGHTFRLSLASSRLPEASELSCAERHTLPQQPQASVRQANNKNTHSKIQTHKGNSEA